MGLFYKSLHQPMRVAFSALYNIRTFNMENMPKEGPVLVLSNHQSFLDPILCSVGLDRELDYMARESLFRNPIFGTIIRKLNAFPVSRGESDIKAIKEIINRLKQGRAVTMFPEATRTRNGKIATIKSGFELIARRSKATIVPVVIEGAFEVWPRTQPLPGLGRIHVQYGTPITPEDIKTMSREELVDLLNNQLRTMQSEMRTRIGKQPFDYESKILPAGNS